VERPVEVGSLADRPEARVTVVQVEGRDLALVRRGEAVYAFRDVCPHMTTSFAGGAVGDQAAGRVGEPEYLSDRPIVTCPWHRYEFSIVTGHCVTNPALRVRTYPVELRGGQVVVDLAGRVGAG
jgi:nitrite reductase/ring-hydroxylating ferredoxin subunit